MFFLLNQGSAACVGITGQFYLRTRRQRPKDDQSVVFRNALLRYVHIAMINRQASRLLTKFLMFHRFYRRHSTVLIVS